MRFISAFTLAAASALWALGGCNGPAEQSATPPTPPANQLPDSGAAAPLRPDTAAATAAGEPVNLAGRTFRLRSFALNSTSPDAMPKFGIYLYPSQLPDSVLVAEDTKPNPLDPGQWADLGVPAAAVSVFQTYYAGAGAQYYALAEGNRLRVYRKQIEEASPENQHTPLPQWRPFKAFLFFADGVRLATP